MSERKRHVGPEAWEVAGWDVYEALRQARERHGKPAAEALAKQALAAVQPPTDPFQRIDAWMCGYNQVSDDLIAVGVPVEAALALCKALQSVNAIVTLMAEARPAEVSLAA